METRLTTGDSLVLLREPINIEYKIGQFYFGIGDSGQWVALVEMTEVATGKTHSQDIDMIVVSLKMPIMSPPESVEFCKELIRMRKQKQPV
jgi:hypothetical protein